MSAIELFEKIRKDGFQIYRMEWTYETIVAYAERTGGASSDAVRVQGGFGASFEDKVADFVDLREAIDRLRTDYEANLQKAEKLLQKCENQEAATLIRLHYISRLSWEEVADFAHFSVRHTRRLAKEELRKLE